MPPPLIAALDEPALVESAADRTVQLAPAAAAKGNLEVSERTEPVTGGFVHLVEDLLWAGSLSHGPQPSIRSGMWRST